MKFVLLCALLFVGVFATPVPLEEIFEDEDGIEHMSAAAEFDWAEIPDGFGGMKYAYVGEGAGEEATPFFDAPRDVRFLIFTRFNPTNGQLVRFNDIAALRASNYVATRPTRFLIHGFQSDAASDINILTTAAYLRNYDVNVIVIDWGIGMLIF